MANVFVRMKDGSRKEFLHRGRPGGSYTVTVHYVNGFVIVEDEYFRRTAIPAEDVAEVTEEPHRGSW